VDGRIAQQIVDRNGHSKTVWISTEKGSPSLAATRNRVPVAPPMQAKSFSITSSDIQNWTDRNNLPLSSDEDFIDLVNATVVSNGDYSDTGLKNAYDQVFHDNFGGYSVESLRAALRVGDEATQEPKVIDSSDSRIQNGEVFDTITSNGILFERSREDIEPSYYTDSIRLQFSRPLSEEETKAARDLVAYAWKAQIRGTKQLGEAEQDSPYSFIAEADVQASPRRNPVSALRYMEGDIHDYIANGTSQQNESLRIPAVDSDLRVEVYYGESPNSL